MLRRFSVPRLRVGQITLDPVQTKHARDVLRLETGSEIELFDTVGTVATGAIVSLNPHVTVEVSSLAVSQTNAVDLTIASAVPKGDRADWMIEKLSELGVSRFIPLATERSVVHPEGRNKLDRWTRIATESAKQSRRAGMMQIAELTPLRDFVPRAASPCFYLSPLAEVRLASITAASLIIGPEGGWTDAEIQQFAAAGVEPVKLTDTILRIETAAVAAAAVVMTRAASNPPTHP